MKTAKYCLYFFAILFVLNLLRYEYRINQFSGKLRTPDYGTQELEIVFARLKVGTNPICEPAGFGIINHEELESLNKLGLKGELFSNGVHRFGYGDKKARMLIVMQTNVVDPVELKHPDGTNVIYLQTDRGFTLLPAGNPTVAKTIELKSYDDPMGSGPTTVYSINIGVGSRGGTAIMWGNKHVKVRGITF